jgi:hypothetical protein
MTLHVFTIQEKLEAVENLIALWRRTGAAAVDLDLLKAIAADLRARLDHVPSAALVSLEQRVVAMKRTRSTLGYHTGAMIGLSQEVAARWPVVRQALERFGAEVETKQASWPALIGSGNPEAHDYAAGHKPRKP